MDNGALSSYSNMKRRISLIVFPIIILYNAWYWVFTRIQDDFIHVALPFAILVCLLAWIFSYRNVAVRFAEFSGLGVFTLYHLGRIYASVHAPEDGTLNLYLPWSALFYMTVFMILEEKKGFVYSLLVYALTLGMGLPRLSSAHEFDGMLGQLYVTNLVYISILYYFQKLFGTYSESKIAAMRII